MNTSNVKIHHLLNPDDTFRMTPHTNNNNNNNNATKITANTTTPHNNTLIEDDNDDDALDLNDEGWSVGGSDEEGGAEESGVEKVLDVQYNANLTETSFSKAEFMTFIKAYLKKLKTYLEENGKADRVDTFMKGAQDFIKFVVSKFDDWQFFTGASESLDGGIILAYWEDESATGPVFYFFKDGLKEEKY